MSCTPIDIKKGPFEPQDWTTAAKARFDGKTLALTKSGLFISPGDYSYPKLPNHTLRYMILGGKYLLILDTELSEIPSLRQVFVVDFTQGDGVSVSVLDVIAAADIPRPVIQASPDNGVVFLGFASDSAGLKGIGIYRSDNGLLLCAVGDIDADGGVSARAEGDSLIIHYPGMSRPKECLLPLGRCEITPPSRTFDTGYVKACNAKPTGQFTIKNIGEDCLEIESISDNPPFRFKSTNPHLPAGLAPNESMLVTIEFIPNTVRSWSSDLEVITSPPIGDSVLHCEGESRNAEFKIQFSPSNWPIDFGTVPVDGGKSERTLTIKNHEPGSKKIRVAAAALDDINFKSDGLDAVDLDCGKSKTFKITFDPSQEGECTATLRITSGPQNIQHDVGLIGIGCVPNAQIEDISLAPISFGQVEQGYRTVRLLKVSNTGDGPLTFVGEIAKGIELFALPDPDGSVVEATPLRKFKAKPVQHCSVEPEEGSGEVLVAVSFFANEPANDDGTPQLVTGSLTLRDHNATNFPPDHRWQIPLTAEIVPPVPLDIALVVDRSGSMEEPLGDRKKMDAAKAASQLFVELLRADLLDRVAVVRFNHEPGVVVPMSPVSDVNSPTKQEILVDIQGLQPDGETAIAGGAMTGIKEILKPRGREKPANLKQAVVVLTDGMENHAFHDPETDKWYSIMGVALPQPTPASWVTEAMPKPAGITIYAIGLGKGDQLNEIQLQDYLASTVDCYHHIGQNLTGEKYFDLEKAYTQIFIEATNLNSILDPVYWINPLDKHIIDFEVLRGDVSVLIVVYDYRSKRLPFYCLSPKEEMIDPSDMPAGFQLRSGFTSHARILEFKMPLNEPDRYAGRWQLIVEHPGQVCRGDIPDPPTKPGFLPLRCVKEMRPVQYGFAIGVGSNFRMQAFVTPGPVYTGDPILLTAMMSEAGLPVPGCEVTVDITLPNGTTLSWPLTLHDDGNHQDGEPKDGEYANSFSQTSHAGTYHFKFKAVGESREGGTANREIIRNKLVSHRATEPPLNFAFQDLVLNVKGVYEAVREQNSLLKRLLKKQKK